ncbi:hypothetical protein [Ammoniphilus resinae]|uniref:Lipoprotein n=1 Tax=Ammoniphilus resinae TaxID=861532 RepID=A0ABS4GSV4_9BACL|nr:hypothetical protein [Ammoniphilus resinae]MBP1933346.1 hypothetical protein [Ammoniphilus resinae]
MNKIFLFVVGISLLILLSACEKGTMGDINVDFGSIDAIRIQTMEQVEKNNASERYEIQNVDEVSDFINKLRTSKKIGKSDEPFPLGDGVITLASKGSNIYGIRYYLKRRELLDLHKGVYYEFPDGLEQWLGDLENMPKVNNIN